LQLRVLTFNIWGLGFGIAKDRGLRVQAFTEALSNLNADVIGLQEVWIEADRRRIAFCAAEAGLEHSYYFRGGLVGSGLMILSRFPITETNFCQFTLKSRPERFWEGDFFAGKGIGMARLQTPHGPLDFYTLHPVAQYAPDDEDPYGAHRSAAMYEAARFINVNSAQDAVIVTGDFNVTPQQPGYTILKTLACLTDAYASLHPDEIGVTFSDSNYYNRMYQHYREPARLDYVCVRRSPIFDLHPQRAEIILKDMPTYPGKPYSDHYGVMVDLQINVAPGRPAASDPQQVHDVLQAFARSLDNARLRARQRRRGLLARFLFLLGTSVSLTVRKQGESAAVRGANTLLLMPFALLQGLLGIVNLADEIQGLHALKAEVDIRLRYDIPLQEQE
jgi:sphingomyelin phosphodiesterase 2